MKPDLRSVLLVAYHFPPDGAVGAIRPAKFAKYLAEFHWEPVVVTVPIEHVRVVDEARLRDLAGTRIVRAPVLPTPLELALRARRAVASLWSRRLPRGSRGDQAGHAPRPIASTPAGEGSNKRGRVLDWLDAVFEFPDKQVGWLLPALWRAVRLIHRHKIPVVIATSPPRTALVVAYLACLLTGAALVLDFRDPWRMQAGPDQPGPTGRSRRALDWLEGRLVRYARLIVTTTPEHAEDLCARYAELPAGRVETIFNGFDSDDLRQLRRRPADDRFVISYLGTFYLERTPGLVLEVLADLVRQGVIGLHQLRVRLVGHVESVNGTRIGEMVDRLGLSEATVISAPVPYPEALQIMAESDVLLLLAPAQYYSIPAKAFDYLGVGVPILCVADEGATSRLVRSVGAGPVVAPRDRDGLRTAVETLLRHRGSAQLVSTGSPRARFDRRLQTGRLAALLDRIVERDGRTMNGTENGMGRAR